MRRGGQSAILVAAVAAAIGGAWGLAYRPPLVPELAGLVCGVVGLGWGALLLARGRGLAAGVLSVFAGLGMAPAVGAALYRTQVVWGVAGLAVMAALVGLGLAMGLLLPPRRRGSFRLRGVRWAAAAVAVGGLSFAALAPVFTPRGTSFAVVRVSGKPAPVLVFGMDCADWRVLEPLLERGELPALSRLIARGRHGVLRSMDPTESAVVWTSMLTGQTPGRHGIRGWDTADARNRRVPALWEIFAAAGARTVTVNVPGTWPPRRVPRGVVVSGFPVPGLDTGTTGFHLGVLVTPRPRPGPVTTVPMHPGDGGSWTFDFPLATATQQRWPWFSHAALDLALRHRLMGRVLRVRGRCIRDAQGLHLTLHGVARPLALAPHTWTPWLEVQADPVPAILRVVWLHTQSGGPTLYFSPPVEDPSARLRPVSAPPAPRILSPPGRPYVVEGIGWTACRDPRVAPVLPQALLDVEATHAEAVERLTARIRPSLLTYVVTATDRLQHAYLALDQPQLYPRLPAHLEDLAGRDPVRRGYRLADRALARLMDLMPPETTVLVVSDHGVTPRPATGDAGHRLEGVWIAAGPGIAPGPAMTLELLDVVPTVLACSGLPVAHDMPGVAHRELCPEAVAAAPIATYVAAEGAGASVGIDAARQDQLRGLGYLQ